MRGNSINFTKEELINFAKQYDAFQKRCEHVANIFAKYDRDYKYPNHDWELDYSDKEDVANQQIHIFNEADIYESGEWIDTVTLSFPFNLLSYTDEQLKEYMENHYEHI